MKILSLLFITFLLLQTFTTAQQIITEQSHEPVFFKVTSHDSNITELPEKSFYESRTDWQYIIDTTWGPGLPLAQKQQIFNAYVSTLEDKFDGFESLGHTQTTWDTLVDYYINKIDPTTSKGRFSAIMYYFAMNLRDGHTYAFDEEVAHTPLNPGIPVLVLGSLYQNEHFGAALTVLEDSTALVLRADNDHPLNLEPGDIILGYEGVLWKDLVQELLEAELPAFGGREYHGGTTGSSSSYDNGLHICVGMNWHLFNTIDILKYSTGEIVHLSVAPLLNLNLPPMINNEQLEIPSIPFPNYWSGELVTFGILPNSNIGYVYVISEWPTAPAEQQFFEAIAALHNTDGLVIDMRWNAGGWALWHDAFAILSNEVTYSIDDALRCSPSNWLLCPENDTVTYRIAGNPTDQYERPIAVLLGPACFSMGDLNAYRLRYLSTVKTFGRPTAANLGWNNYVTNFPLWTIRYSMGDMYHLNQPGHYLNRKEFPIDYPVWFNKVDVANGYDTVVEEALGWMNELVYGHDVTTNTSYALPGNDTVIVSAIIENPNAHNVNAQIFIKDLDNTLIDSLELSETERGDIWQGEWVAVNQEDFFKLEVKTTDQTTGESFIIENVNRITTAGPMVIYDLDSSYLPGSDIWQFKPHFKNEGQTLTIENLFVSMLSDDSTITSISGPLYVASIAPGEIITHPGNYSVRVDSNFSGEFSFNFEFINDGWTYWIDSMRVPPIAIISINPTELAFGEVALDSSATKTFTITNYGDEDLVISDITSSELVFTVNITSAVVPPDSSQAVEVTFTPTGTISFNGIIEITHNADGSPDSVVVTGDGVTGVDDELQPLTFSLEQNYPNPFNPSTTIKYSIPEISKVTLTLYNLLGEQVATLVNEEKIVGYYIVEFNASILPSGVYFYRIKAGSFVETKKMVLLR